MNPKPRSMLRWLAALALTLGLLAACGGDDAPADATVRQSVGAAGGSLRSADGKMSLTIPAGALGIDTEITITEVSPDNQSDAVRQLGADKVYWLEPAGLMFAQPAMVEIELPASATGQVAVLLLHSAGQWEAPGAQTLALSVDKHTLSGQLNHFSELVVIGTTITHELQLVPRLIAPGEELDASLRVDNSGGQEVVVRFDDSHLSPSGPLGAFYLSAQPRGSAGNELMEFVDSRSIGNPTLFARVDASFTQVSRYRCLKPHSGTVTYAYELEFPPGPAFFLSEVSLWISIVGIADYVCQGSEPPPPSPPTQAIRTGLFPLPLGMKQPDGLQLVQRAFAGLTGNTVHALIAGSNGVVGIDLKTGAVSLDQTPTGADGALGNGPLLGVTAVSQPIPGATTHAGLFGAGALGSAQRSFVQFNNGAWGWSQILLLGQVLQWASSGGGLEASEVLGVRPGLGLVANRFDGVAYRQSGEGSVDASHFEGNLVSVAVPSSVVGSSLQVATHTDGGTTTSVWHHDRSRTPGTLLFKVPGVAKVLRCMDQALSAALGSQRLCGLTTDDALFYWQYDTLDPAAVPSVASVPVGPGAVGVQFGLGIDDMPWAVVANFEDHSLNIFDLDYAGQVQHHQKVAVPAGCLNPAHAAPFSHAGKDYVAGTCYGSDRYFVFEKPGF